MNAVPIIIGLVTAAAFSGCAEAIGFAPGSEPEPDIFGLIIDQDGTLLEGATVTLEPGGAVATSDAAGEYAFFDVPYDVPIHLVATYDGHHQQTADVQVGEFLSAQVVFTLIDLDELPTHFVTSFGGFFGCRVPGSPPCPFTLDRPADAFVVDPPHSDRPLADALVEVVWSATPGSTDTFRVVVTPADAAPIEAEGTSPLRLHVPFEPVLDILVEPAGLVPVSYSQPFDVHVTHAIEALGNDYSALSS